MRSYFLRDLVRIGAIMMMGGPRVRSRKIRIIKNAPMFLLTFQADSASVLQEGWLFGATLAITRWEN